MEQLVWILKLTLVLGATLGHGASVSCVSSRDCVLPCTSVYHDVIHWYRGENIVHSFFQAADQLRYQDASFSNRTSLFNDQIPKGNLSLLLRPVRISDRGTYKCYTADKTNNQEQFVTLDVKAPIEAVEIGFENSTTTCGTSRVFPEPRISWTVDDRPASEFRIKTEQNTDTLHFSMSSTLNVPVQNNRTYKCSVSLQDLSQTYTASIRTEEVELSGGEDATVHCPLPDGDVEHYNLTLRFDSIDVLAYISASSAPPSTSTTWRDTEVRLQGRGNGTIKEVGRQHGGTYACERVTAQSRQIVQTQVKIKSDYSTHVVVTIVIIVLIIAGGITAGIICSRKNSNSYQEASQNNQVDKN